MILSLLQENKELKGKVVATSDLQEQIDKFEAATKGSYGGVLMMCEKGALQLGKEDEGPKYPQSMILC